MRKPNVELMCDSHHGVYIPQIMIPRLIANGWRNIPQDAYNIAIAGPYNEQDNDQYWSIWDEVLDNAEWHDDHTSQIFKLYQDGDVFAYCKESMTPTEYFNMFGEFPEWYSEEI
ncbi:hypothetical protein [Yersinia phage fHe-Yen9-03]|uniref:Uncharacterized protein n=1 Tax=Yersinia phage fHe-Yen9-03 TaxID=2052743 RepID=A0A2C9CY91_9CAUD|nr:hypothetical protein [Yersinia phage fHe-Yen9-03]